jgi:hypothetical protein
MPDPDDEAVQVRYVLWRDQRTMTDAEFDAQREAELRGEPQPCPLSEEMLSHLSAAEREAYLARLRALPRRVLDRLPAAVPQWLLDAKPDEEVRIFRDGFDYLESASAVRFGVEFGIARRAVGRLQPEEVAQLLAVAGDMSESAVLEHVVQAFEAGHLRFYSEASALRPIDPADPKWNSENLPQASICYGDAYTTAAEVDSWIERERASGQRVLPRMPSGPWSISRLPRQQPNEGREGPPAEAASPAAGQDAAGAAPTLAIPKKDDREGLGKYRARLVAWAVETAGATRSVQKKDIGAYLEGLRPDLFVPGSEVFKHAWNAYKLSLKR